MPTLYRRGRVHTPERPDATAFVVEGRDIAWIGVDSDAPDVADAVDLDGALVTPAFVDAHVHATATGLAHTGLDLRGARSLREALDAVERVARSSRGRPILGGGWDDNAWPERRPPTANELDRAAYGGVVYLARVDIHSAVVSSSVMAAVPGLAELAGYRASGWMGEPDAHDAVREAAHAMLPRGQRREAQRAFLAAAAGLGVAAVHEMAGPVISAPDDLADLLAVARDEAVCEVVGYWGELGGVDTARELGAIGAGGDLFCDGALGSGTAALHEPYADRAGTGWLRFETDALVEHVVACAHAGLQAGFHAIGDAAIDQVLEAYELASQRLGRPAGRADRIEHAEYVRDPARLAASGLTASVQPVFDALWGGRDGLYADRLGADRALQLNRLADSAAVGVPLAFGSDTPVTELGPWAAVRAATRHHDPAASLDADAAFAAHTRAGWRAAGNSNEGELRTGRPATFAVWQQPDGADLASPADVVAADVDPQCVHTVLRGRTIHTSGG